MTIKHIFKSRIPSMTYVFQRGAVAHFIGGRFMTDIYEQIAELEAECKSGNPTIYIDEAEMSIDSDALSPLDTIKKKAVEEYLASVKSATLASNDMGSTEISGKVSGILSSSGAGDNTPDSSGLANLKAKLSK